MALPACSTVPSAPPTLIEVDRALKPAPAEAMAPCPEPTLWSDYVSAQDFLALGGEGQVNKVLAYAAYVVAVGGECAVRHKALVEHREDLDK